MVVQRDFCRDVVLVLGSILDTRRRRMDR